MMTSSEKILSGIIDEAKQNADEIIADAEKKAEQDTAAKKDILQKECDAIISAAEKKAEILKSTGVSSAALIKRDRTLACRREIIADILTEAEKAVNEMDDEDYFEFIAQIAMKNVLSQKGEILLSEKDLKRDTGILEKKLSGEELVLSKDAAKINGGFILRYGDIQINGEIKALLHEKRELLVDSINRTLFA